MANVHRGEIEAEFNGQTYTLCLTLGALAELESALGGADILSLAERFESGQLRAGDAVCVLGAGLRGAGHDISDVDIKTFQTPGGAAGFIDIISRLLQATFTPLGAQEVPKAPEKKL